MKQVLLIILTTICSYVACAQQTCRIYYNYDDNGQRIKRYYFCTTPGTVYETVRFTVFPNPTSGPFSVFADEVASLMSAKVTSMGGQIISTASCENCNLIGLDISSAATGSYVVDIVFRRTGLPDINKGFTIVKTD